MGLFNAFSKSCNSLTKAVQAKSQKGSQRRAIANERTKQEEFLHDVDLLNHEIEMKERKRLMDTDKKGKKSTRRSKKGKSTNANAIAASTNGYVAMEHGDEQDNKLADDQQEQQSDKIDVNDEEELHFVWVLLRFAKNRSWKKKLMTVLIVSTSFYVLADLLFLGNIMRLIHYFLVWMIQQPGAAVGCFLAFFVIATLLFVPPTILYFGAGYAFANVAGFWAGLFASTVVCFIGSCLGAILAFLRSRYMMRDLIELFAKRFPIVKCLDRAIEKKGFRVMLMMRLCPVVPFNGLNYVGGVTKISMEEYTFALVGVIPNIILWVLVGASAENVQQQREVDKEDNKGEFVFMVISMTAGIVFAAVGLFMLYRYGRDELHKEIKEERALSWHTFANEDRGSQKVLSDLDPDDQIEQGFEALEKPAGLVAVLGLDHHVIESDSIPEDGRDEDWLWVWA
eukprot:CAMPEP_0198145016 /NCGR_PEP_ID=MMETSP1443-20131203/20372_1 /TAXON_ID=186043 /ORGANISM="Entomoneis sp., Strain CCMP2396" /LENGTH=452 /DNA_ID=CAMNT_0043808527 /DNA_START=135 /DNA_END=1493 /DNA_ORIENTATION=-